MDYLLCFINFIKENAASILIGVGTGAFSSYGVWWFLFHYFIPQISFSEQISKTIKDGKSIYSFKFENSGSRKVIDLQINIRFRVKGLDGDNWKVIYIPHSEDEKDQIPFLSPTRKNLNPMRERREFLITKAKFDQDIFPETIREKYTNKTFELEDLFKLGKEQKLQVNIFCYDEFSGTRKLFSSKNYTSADIIQGKFEKGSLKIFKE